MRRPTIIVSAIRHHWELIAIIVIVALAWSVTAVVALADEHNPALCETIDHPPGCEVPPGAHDGIPVGEDMFPPEGDDVACDDQGTCLIPPLVIDASESEPVQFEPRYTG